MDTHCVCHGIQLARKLVIHTDDPSLPGTRKVAERLHTHLSEQASKPENAHLLPYVQKQLDAEGLEILRDSYKENESVMGLERVRDDIHQSPELKQLLLCGSLFEDKSELKHAMGFIERSWEIMATSANCLGALRPLDDLAKHYGCDL